MASRSEDTRCTACNGTGEVPLVGGGYDPTRPCPVCAGTGSKQRVVDLNAEYDKACRVFHEACKAVEAAEDARDMARRECVRLERELGL